MPKSLLLADDSATIQTAVQMTFKAEDVSLTVVSDGNEALARAKAVKPDLILADVEMPGVGGYELCAKLRGDAATRHIPVLLLGGGTPVDPAKAIAVGANGHMAKPFDSQKLIEQVKQILANPKAMPAAAATARPSGPPPAAARPAGAAAPGGSPPPRPAAPLSRPTAPGARPPQPGGAPASTLTMARPPTSPGMRPVAPPSRPPGTGPVGPRPAAPTSRPPGPVPGARPSQPAAARAPVPPGSRPPAQVGARPLAPRPPGPVRPAPAQAKPPAPQPPEQTLRHALPGDEDLPMEVDEIVEESAPPAPLRPVPPPVSRQPSLSVVSGKGDGGEALLREALSKASREVIEKIAWEVVPELAETIIREELERLMKERGA